MNAMASEITSLTIVYFQDRSFRSKKTSKFRVTGLCVRNSPVTDGFPTQRASNAENVSIWWRHHDRDIKQRGKSRPWYNVVRNLSHFMRWKASDSDHGATTYMYPRAMINTYRQWLGPVRQKAINWLNLNTIYGATSMHMGFRNTHVFLANLTHSGLLST